MTVISLLAGAVIIRVGELAGLGWGGGVVGVAAALISALALGWTLGLSDLGAQQQPRKAATAVLKPDCNV